MTILNTLTNELTTARSAEVLRDYIGPRKKFSYDSVAATIDVEVRTVESWVLGQSVPRLYPWLKLCALLGPEFVNRYLRLVGIDGAENIEGGNVSDAEMNAEVAQLVSAFSQALKDLRIDHTEMPNVVKTARATHDMLTQWINAHDATGKA